MMDISGRMGSQPLHIGLCGSYKLMKSPYSGTLGTEFGTVAWLRKCDRSRCSLVYKPLVAERHPVHQFPTPRAACVVGGAASHKFKCPWDE